VRCVSLCTFRAGLINKESYSEHVKKTHRPYSRGNRASY
jgi:hypothetical protein